MSVGDKNERRKTKTLRGGDPSTAPSTRQYPPLCCDVRMEFERLVFGGKYGGTGSQGWGAIQVLLTHPVPDGSGMKGVSGDSGVLPLLFPSNGFGLFDFSGRTTFRELRVHTQWEEGGGT